MTRVRAERSPRSEEGAAPHGRFLGRLPGLSKLLSTLALLELVAVGARYGVQVAIARLAGVTDYGQFTVALAWSTTLALAAGIGLSGVAIRYVPTYLALERYGRLKGFIRFARLVTLASSGALLLVGAVITVLTSEGSTRTVTLVGLLLIPAVGQSSLQAEVLRAAGRVIAARVIVTMLQPVAFLVLALAYRALGGSLTATGAMLCLGLAYIITLMVQATAIRLLIGARLHDQAAVHERREWSRLGLHLLAVRVSQTVLNSSDVIIVGILVGPAEAGIYGAAVKSVVLVSVVTQAVNLQVPPSVARLLAQDRHTEVEALVRRSARFAFLPSLLLALGLGIASSLVMGVFGASFEAGAAALTILAIGRLVTAWTGPVGSLLNVSGHQQIPVRVYAAAAALQVGLDFALIPSFGIDGAAVAASVAMIFWNLLLSYFVIKHMKVRLWPLAVTGARR